MIFGVNTLPDYRIQGKYGFVDEGVSDKSTHGNVQWHQMRLCLN